MNGGILKRYLVIVADRQRGKFFTIYMNTFEDEGEEVIDKDVPQKVKVDNARPGKVERHIRDHLYKHLKYVGKKALDYVLKQYKHLDGVVVGGHKELVNKTKEYLPPQLKSKVLGVFIAGTDLSIGELTEKAREVTQKHEH